MLTIRTTYAHLTLGAHRALRYLTGPRGISSTSGQGTVEYVGIVLVIGALLIALKSGMTGVEADTLAKAISNGVSGAIKTVIAGKG